jgi:hypothetical protein
MKIKAICYVDTKGLNNKKKNFCFFLAKQDLRRVENKNGFAYFV